MQMYFEFLYLELGLYTSILCKLSQLATGVYS
jgi:hypothetical protein